MGFPIPPCALVVTPRKFSRGTAVSPSDSLCFTFGLYFLTAPYFLMQMLHWAKVQWLLERFWHRPLLLEGASLDETGQVASLAWGWEETAMCTLDNK